MGVEMVEVRQKFLNVKDTSVYLGVRFGGAIRYGIPDLDAWAEAQVRASTSDTGAAA
jgi:hypothetical protein